MADEPKGSVETRNIAGAMTGMRVDELISNLAIGVAKGQMALDQACMELAQFMGEPRISFGKKPGTNEPDTISLLELGFTPNFYQFVDTQLEVRVAVSAKLDEQTNTQSSQTGQSEESSASAGKQSKSLELTTVDAKYASTYSYSVEASSMLKTKIVAVPPPSVFEEIVQARIKARKEEEQRARWKAEVRTAITAAATATTQLLNNPALPPGSPIDAAGAAALKSAVAAMAADYGALTTDHWAVVGNVELRKAADEALAAGGAAAAALAQAVGAADAEAVRAAKTALASALNAFAATLPPILQRVPAPPPAPATP